MDGVWEVEFDLTTTLEAWKITFCQNFKRAEKIKREGGIEGDGGYMEKINISFLSRCFYIAKCSLEI